MAQTFRCSAKSDTPVTAYYGPATRAKSVRVMKCYRAECPVSGCRWMGDLTPGEHFAHALLDAHLAIEHACDCKDGWVIINPNWPSGDGPFRERCPEGCETGGE